MNFAKRYSGTLVYIRSNWPRYLFLFGGGSLVVIFVLSLSIVREWPAFVLISAAILIVILYFFGASIWAGHRLYDDAAYVSAILDLAEISPQDTFAHISLGLKRTAVDLSRVLTTGKVIIIDVYNPQLVPGKTLLRARQLDQSNEELQILDPRLSWREGTIDLIPLPDKSTPLVTMVETLSEFWQPGDQMCLLKEIYRILTPNGRLILVEKTLTLANFFAFGPESLRLNSAAKWSEILTKAGFSNIEQRTLYDMVQIFRAEKSSLSCQK